MTITHCWIKYQPGKGWITLDQDGSEEPGGSKVCKTKTEAIHRAGQCSFTHCAVLKKNMTPDSVPGTLFRT